MSTKSAFSVLGLAHKFGKAWEDAGGSVAELNALAEDGTALKQFLAVLRGAAEIKPIGCVVDCDVAPFVPDGWKVEEHRKGGLIDLASIKTSLVLAEAQKVGGWVIGNELRKLLADKPVLNANVLDFLLAHPHLIPEEWKCRAVSFWGTIYRDRYGCSVVRRLSWHGDGWRWSDGWLDTRWHSFDLAACGQASA